MVLVEGFWMAARDRGGIDGVVMVSERQKGWGFTGWTSEEISKLFECLCGLTGYGGSSRAHFKDIDVLEEVSLRSGNGIQIRV
jgi:hypothetical protein